MQPEWAATPQVDDSSATPVGPCALCECDLTHSDPTIGLRPVLWANFVPQDSRFGRNGPFVPDACVSLAWVSILHACIHSVTYEGLVVASRPFGPRPLGRGCGIDPGERSRVFPDQVGFDRNDPSAGCDLLLFGAN